MTSAENIDAVAPIPRDVPANEIADLFAMIEAALDHLLVSGGGSSQSSRQPPVSVYVHPQELCESQKVGAGTRVWAFAHVLAGATIRTDCNTCDHVFVENDVVLGDRVTIKSSGQL